MKNNQSINSSKIIAESGVAFGTSGARGLVTQFTNEVCAAFTHAFIACMKRNYSFEKVAVAIDNRPSSHGMAMSCIQALETLGLEAVYYGVVPTPALAYVSVQDNIPCIMVTGSHIPFDRNGLKFYRPDGEISKVDEAFIVNADVDFIVQPPLSDKAIDNSAAQRYIKRYTSLCSSSAFSGMRIGIYEHSSAGRDIYAELFNQLGAEVISIERTDKFVPIDTEAVSKEDQDKAFKWSKDLELDAIFSTDGDGDRPLVADENGQWLRGDILGLIAAKQLDVEALAVPVSCNTVIDSCGYFKQVSRTRIGSPYVIEEFASLASKFMNIAGFEANGGFLLGSNINTNNAQLSALPTRDAVLPFILLLLASKQEKISHLVNEVSGRVTSSDRIKDFAGERSTKVMSDALSQTVAFLNRLGFSEESVVSIDSTDGARLTLSSGVIVHLRPSGNAPELRCYVEAETVQEAQELVARTLSYCQECY